MKKIRLQIELGVNDGKDLVLCLEKQIREIREAKSLSNSVTAMDSISILEGIKNKIKNGQYMEVL